MEVVSPGTITHRKLVFALSPLFFLLTGCVTSASYLALDRPASDICRVVVAWNPEVIFTPDPVHNGQPTPGLAGRVYLFGSEVDYPRVGDGSIVVDLYKDSTAGKEANALPLEEWRIDADTLKRLKRKDAIGWGYTLFLPWGTYQSQIKHIELRLRYVPARGTPLYAQSSPLTLNRGGSTTPVSTQRTETLEAKAGPQQPNSFRAVDRRVTSGLEQNAVFR